MKQAFFILFFLVSVFVSKAQNVNQALSVTDTADLTIRLDSSVIVINKNILDKQFWVNLFVEDYTFINYFQNNRNKPMYVYINKIDVFDSATFRFKILSRPVINKTYQANGLCDYIIKCGLNPISKKSSIMRIEFRGCEI
jgi:hypothetical protein